MSNSPCNPKQLFSTIHNILKHQAQVHRETTEKQCNNFMSFSELSLRTSALSSQACRLLNATAVIPHPEISQPFPSPSTSLTTLSTCLEAFPCEYHTGIYWLHFCHTPKEPPSGCLQEAHAGYLDSCCDWLDGSEPLQVLGVQ